MCCPEHFFWNIIVLPFPDLATQNMWSSFEILTMFFESLSCWRLKCHSSLKSEDWGASFHPGYFCSLLHLSFPLFWLVCHLLQRQLSFWKLHLYPQKIAGALTGWPSGSWSPPRLRPFPLPITQFRRATSSRKSPVGSKPMMENPELIGTFKAAEMFLYLSPDLCLKTILSQRSTDNFMDFMLGVSALTCTVNCGTQLSSPSGELGSTSMFTRLWSKRTRVKITTPCHNLYDNFPTLTHWNWI